MRRSAKDPTGRHAQRDAAADGHTQQDALDDGARTRRRRTKLLIGIGIALITAAIVLAASSHWRTVRANESVKAVLSQLEEAIPAEHAGSMTASAATAAKDADGHPEMPTVEIDGHSYIGIVRIPALDLSFPVLDGWDDSLLDIAPCRYRGSAYDGSLVISGRDHASHLGELGSLQVGDSVMLTDVDGQLFSYQVTGIDDPDDVDDDRLGGATNGTTDDAAADLTLFVYLSSSDHYVVAHCTLI